MAEQNLDRIPQNHRSICFKDDVGGGGISKLIQGLFMRRNLDLSFQKGSSISGGHTTNRPPYKKALEKFVLLQKVLTKICLTTKSPHKKIVLLQKVLLLKKDLL